MHTDAKHERVQVGLVARGVFRLFLYLHVRFFSEQFSFQKEAGKSRRGYQRPADGKVVATGDILVIVG